MFVGDNPDDDIEGASHAGLRPVWKRVSYWRLLRDDVPAIDALSEILPMCVGPDVTAAGSAARSGR